MTPALSVVIPTFHRPELLRRCLLPILAQRLGAGSFEVIVVDDGHDDATRRLVEELQSAGQPAEAAAATEGAPVPPALAPTLRYLRPAQGRGPAVARNAGWRAARAPLIAFTDDDTVPQPGWLDSGLQAMARHPDWSALCGRVTVPLAPPSRRRPTDHELMTLGLQSAEFVTANAFVRRAALVRICGFDERFTRAWREDSDLQFRLMQDVGPVGRGEDAEVLHPVRAERWGVCMRQQRNAFFDALLYKKHPRLYRERIHPAPPWRYYGIVGSALGALLLASAGQRTAALGAAAAAGALVLNVAARRLRDTSRAPAHVLEMVATSAAIPFLSVYWRLRGALRFRVLFL